MPRYISDFKNYLWFGLRVEDLFVGLLEMQTAVKSEKFI